MTAKQSVKSWHRPLHIYKDNSIYFITVRTIDRIKYFNSDKKKDILSDVIHTACEKFCKDLTAWTILDNHYHILVEVDEGKNIPKLVNNINANSSRILNISENCIGRQVWHQYFDRCIRDEKDYWTRFNYTHHNCVKHGYAKSMEDYKYSSYNQWVNDKGVEWMPDSTRKRAPHGACWIARESVLHKGAG